MKIKLDKEYNVTLEDNLLGYLGETNARAVYFLGFEIEDVDKYRLRIKYPSGLITDVDILSGMFTPSVSVMREVGEIKCQIIAVKQGKSELDFEVVKRSDIFKLKIKPSLDNTVAPIPEIGGFVRSTIILTQKQYDELPIKAEDTIYYIVPENDNENITEYLGSKSVELNVKNLPTDFTTVLDKLTDLENASRIINTASGTTIQLADSSDLPIQSLKIYGNSTQNGTPTPENPIPIESIGENGSVGVTVTGKNLFSTSELKNIVSSECNYEFITNNAIKLTSTRSTGTKFAQIYGYIDVSKFKGSTLTFSMQGEDSLQEDADTRIYFDQYDKNGNVISGTSSNIAVRTVRQKTFTIAPNAEKLRFIFRLDQNRIETEGGSFVFKDIMLEVGENATAFESFKSIQTATVPLPEPLQSVGDIKDELRVFKDGTGEIIKRIWCENLSNKPWMIASTNKWVLNNAYLPQITDQKHGLSTLFKFTPTGTAQVDGNNFGISKSGQIILGFDHTKTVDELKTAIADCDFMAVYAEPQTIPLTTEEVQAVLSLHTYKPVTNITAGGAEVEVTYVADTKAYIDNKFNELANAIVAQGGV